MRNRIIAAGLAVAAGLLVWTLFGATTPTSAGADEPRSDPRAKLDRRIAGTVREAGALVSARSSTIVNEIPGETILLSILPEGRLVEKGELLATLDDSALRESLEVQRVVVAQAEAAMAEAIAALEAAERRAGIGTERAELALNLAELRARDELAEGGEYDGAVAVAEARLQAAKLVHEVAEKRATEGDGPTAEAHARRATAAADLVEAERTLANLKSGRERREVELRLDVATAREELARLRSGTKAELTATTAAVAKARARRLREEERVEVLEKQIASTEVRAPHAGMVLRPSPSSRRAADLDELEEGEAVRERQPLVWLADPSKLAVDVQIHESRIALVEKGQVAVVRFDAFPDRTWEGRVESVSSVPSPGNWLEPNVRSYSARISLAKPGRELRIGMTAVVEISTASE